MLVAKTKKELSVEAHRLAGGSQYVHHNDTIYMPADFETLDTTDLPDPERTVWLPMTRADVQRAAADQFNTLFQTDAEIRSFRYMVAQSSRQLFHVSTSLLVRTPEGLRRLDAFGKLQEVTGDFVPNFLKPMLNEDKAAKQRVMDVIVEWLGDSQEEADSFLRHLATSLSPGWPAVKYMLLLGEGRNGKGVLMDMLQALFGRENCSSVTRQKISEESPMVAQLNGKLLNLVYDGKAAYLKDSGVEKSLIAGEAVSIKKLWESAPTTVQTNALFIEGLNKEPKSSDKTSALQKRLVRFQFPNVYELDHMFRKSMLTEESIGAFLSILIDYFVMEDSVAKALMPTGRALELQLEHMYINSVGLQYIKHLEGNDPLGAVSILGLTVEELTSQFKSWRLKENDLSTWAEPDVLAIFNPLVNTERKKSIRTGTAVRKVRTLTSFKPEAAAFIENLKGVEDDVDIATLVDD
jgi:hypothetical protein